MSCVVQLHHWFMKWVQSNDQKELLKEFNTKLNKCHQVEFVDYFLCFYFLEMFCVLCVSMCVCVLLTKTKQFIKTIALEYRGSTMCDKVGDWTNVVHSNISSMLAHNTKLDSIPKKKTRKKPRTSSSGNSSSSSSSSSDQKNSTICGGEEKGIQDVVQLLEIIETFKTKMVTNALKDFEPYHNIKIETIVRNCFIIFNHFYIMKWWITCFPQKWKVKECFSQTFIYYVARTKIVFLFFLVIENSRNN